MPVITLHTNIFAPPEVVFDLSRSVDVHVESAGKTNERAIAGKTSGLMELGDEVTWEARHFGVRQRLSVRITEFERPHFFVDEMLTGAFKRFRHLHRFEAIEGGTLMVDEFDFTSPLGPLGRLADGLFLERYMRRFLEGRNLVIKKIGEEKSKK